MSDRSQLIEAGCAFAFDAERETEFARLEKRYPHRESLILPGLWLVQDQLGWIPAEAIGYLADRIGTFAGRVYEAATFYTMYQLRPIGKFHVCVCRTLSCWLRGKQEIVDYFRDEIGIVPGQVSSNGIYSLEEVECLGYCGQAPVVQINGVVYGEMSVEKLRALFAKLEQEGA